MNGRLIYPVGSTAACGYAADFLRKSGESIVDHPTPEATHLLLDIPSFDSAGAVRGGGSIRQILERLPSGITVIGGNLNHPELIHYKRIDLLADEVYLAKNADITAYCAVSLALPMLSITLRDAPVLILGWGRIGKCLARLLRALEADVTVAVRKETDRAMLQGLHYQTIDFQDIKHCIKKFRLIFNTVPHMVLEGRLPDSCIAIELASKPGIDDPKVVNGRGLPGIHAPESSGRLIADTILSKLKKEVCT